MNAHSIIEQFINKDGCFNWQNGDKVKHPDGYIVEIIDGCFYGNYGRVSNFWSWKKVKKDGTLTKKIYHGYGWDPQ